MIPIVIFCNCHESIDHLFFTCPVARVVWACVAQCFGANDIPVNIDQCWLCLNKWLPQWLPQQREVHVWGVAAICWAMWKARNKACFDKKLIKKPVEIVCHAGALMKFEQAFLQRWTGGSRRRG